MTFPTPAGGAVAAIRPQRTSPVALADVARTAGAPLTDLPGTTVTGISLDSRSIHPGDLYAALPGALTHGAAFAANAQTAGAVAVLTDAAGEERARATGLPVLVVDKPRDVLGAVASRIYGEPTNGLRLLGITGTNGKTTTSFLLDAVLRELGQAALIGTIETRIGTEAVKSARTTPEATDLQALFAVMREQGVDWCAMEVSSHALAMGRVDGARFAVAGFTNLTQDHLDFHKTFEEYFAAKASLFTPERCDLAVVNIDDEYGRRLAAQTVVPLVTVSTTRDADWTVGGTHQSEHGTTVIDILGPDETLTVEIGLPGDFNVANALLATVMLRQIGVPAEAIAAGLQHAAVPGRMETFTRADGLSVIVDYAHTPDAVELALRAARTATKGRLYAVVGCGGDRDPGKRPAMGAAAARAADVVIVTDDNPRSEDPAAIRAAAVEGARAAVPAVDLQEVGDRRQAIATAIELAGPGDTVVVLGKGHETGQDVGGVIHPFDDRQTVRELIAATREATL
ncbi:UDP-N-acetylmuramoyl-L-alanyl-D-glutamate--2,6-diaminopimelate ligase [Kribbella sp. CA-293567]|uniref:UDP-N-acetylmuramoyl-L-alanyl-D-glutamate--2, 6-diaminopimelate ligase n=1 Tax=Kribbella sp. CA-293567 TaxID=3002436 RepID=UPI0022DD8793|nr:UDP-N-acetylmuramoyl-L-alanyl-D-glutamate--2,6-diaminopimelate ligase [Kribbella sp. CA-293567]WBQ02592.1 UDP-N-acetylmuramoyl-L-alanyl-D-glutamate--2,6-diaminopimelate ligase [Kribbella sp. CA-293567]